MSYDGIEEEEKQQILKSVMTEYNLPRKDLTISQEDCLQQLKLKFPKETEQTLIRFLRARDFKVQKAERLLSRANEWREHVKPECIELTDVAHELQKGYVLRHYYDKFKRPTLILRAAKYFPSQIRVEDAERLILYLLESGIREMSKEVTGFCMIADMRDVGLINFSLPHFKHFAHLIQDFYPERLGSAFIINVSWVAKTMWLTAKPLLNQRTIEKIHFLETKEMRKLREVFDENVLPVDYGGLAQRLS